MIRHQHFAFKISVQSPAEEANRELALQQGPTAHRPQADDVLRTQYRQLVFEVLTAVLDLFRLRIPIVRRTALDRIENVNVFASEGACLDHLGQQLARFADERSAGSVFLHSGALAKESEPRCRTALAKYRLGATGHQGAASHAGGDLASQRLQLSMSLGISATSLTRSLHLINGPLINQRLAGPDCRLHQLLQQNDDDSEVLNELYLLTLCRTPTPVEREHWMTQMASVDDGNASTRASFFEDLLWALMTSDTFITNH